MEEGNNFGNKQRNERTKPMAWMKEWAECRKHEIVSTYFGKGLR
jgi:hypothetical protein